jgi:cytochrome c oxidase subunit 2
MTGLIVIAILILLGIVVVQIGKVTELSAKIRGEEEIELRNNRTQGRWLMIFMVVFLTLCFVTAAYYRNWMMGYGPHQSASAHGGELDGLFDTTLWFTGIVFVITHVLLFYFGWKYSAKKGQKASFISHNNTLEIVWSSIPAVVMTFLVIKGLVAWNGVMADITPDESVLEIEATGYQFAWHLRYPGPDGLLGTRDYKKITGSNPIGQVWTDDKNLDDIHTSEIVLPVNKKVRVRITSRDVLHSFFLPHFRVKMDAVPGIPTYFVFTPITTTEDYRLQLSQYPEYNVPANADEPDGPMKWEMFDYELACAELCGSSHFAMRRVVRIVSQEEYDAWLATQKSYYMNNIRNTRYDSRIGEVLESEILERHDAFFTEMESLLASPDGQEKVMAMKYTSFETGSATLTKNSIYELSNAAEILIKYPDVHLEVGGHTDNTGDADQNLTLSQQRADVVVAELVKKGIDLERLKSVGYGQMRPAADNETEEGRAENRRTELKIIAQ